VRRDTEPVRGRTHSVQAVNTLASLPWECPSVGDNWHRNGASPHPARPCDHPIVGDLQPPKPPTPTATHRSTEVLLAAGAVGPIAAWCASVPVILGWPGYDPIAESISSLVNSPLGWLQTAAFVVSGLLGVAWAVGLARVLGPSRRDRRLVRGLLLFQAGIAVAFALFPTGSDGLATTTIGALHLANFALYATTMPLTMLVLALIMRRDGRWTNLANPSFVAGFIMLAAVILVPVTIGGPLRQWLGLLERFYVAIPSVWQVAVALAGLRRHRSGAAG